MSIRKLVLVALVLVAIAGIGGFLWIRSHTPRSEHILDEALSASPARDAASFRAADEDYFHDMDQDKNGPVALSPEEIRGRNTWLVWTAGNLSLIHI